MNETACRSIETALKSRKNRTAAINKIHAAINNANGQASFEKREKSSTFPERINFFPAFQVCMFVLLFIILPPSKFYLSCYLFDCACMFT